MRWPWVSRRIYEMECAFFEEMSNEHQESWRTVFAELEKRTDQYIAAMLENEIIRAEANTLKGVLQSHGDPIADRFGPYDRKPH